MYNYRIVYAYRSDLAIEKQYTERLKPNACSIHNLKTDLPLAIHPVDHDEDLLGHRLELFFALWTR